MTTPNIGSTAIQIYELVNKLEKENVLKVFNAVYALCGFELMPPPGVQTVTPPGLPPGTVTGTPFVTTNMTAAKYFAEKDPKTKTDSLAVAARYRELYENAEESLKPDIAAVFSLARKNFDSSNFAMDMTNAKIAGLFVKEGKTTTGFRLTFGGQNYVDALPDRAAASNHLKKSASRGKAAKKKAAK